MTDESDEIAPEPVELVGDGGFTSTVAGDEWLLVGAPAEVRRPRQGPWEGTVLAFHRSRRSLAEWHLASGEKREWRFYSNPDEGFVTGKTFPVKLGGNTWEATVVDDEPAIRVVVKFTIQSGATRRRDFFWLLAVSCGWRS